MTIKNKFTETLGMVQLTTTTNGSNFRGGNNFRANFHLNFEKVMNLRNEAEEAYISTGQTLDTSRKTI